MVQNVVITKIVKREMEAIQKEKKNFILSSYPRTWV